MKISLGSPHLSLVPFSEIELPTFTLITGLNGSGKSQLLDAIMSDKVLTDLVPTRQGSTSLQIVKFSAQEFQAGVSPDGYESYH